MPANELMNLRAADAAAVALAAGEGPAAPRVEEPRRALGERSGRHRILRRLDDHGANLFIAGLAEFAQTLAHPVRIAGPRHIRPVGPEQRPHLAVGKQELLPFAFEHLIFEHVPGFFVGFREFVHARAPPVRACLLAGTPDSCRRASAVRAAATSAGDATECHSDNPVMWRMAGRAPCRPAGSLPEAGSRGPITEKIQSAFFDIVNGRNAKYAEWLTPVV